MQSTRSQGLWVIRCIVSLSYLFFSSYRQLSTRYLSSYRGISQWSFLHFEWGRVETMCFFPVNESVEKDCKSLLVHLSVCLTSFQDESESGIEKIKLIGEIPVPGIPYCQHPCLLFRSHLRSSLPFPSFSTIPVEVVSEVLYHAAYRLAWDKVIEKLVLLQTDDDTSDNCKREVWYIAGKVRTHNNNNNALSFQHLNKVNSDSLLPLCRLRSPA